ncbi:hypothetical protein MK280_15550 [Myxococcota bacterium]|nr:hypothetical protein [Myxococcota bacterium]
MKRVWELGQQWWGRGLFFGVITVLSLSACAPSRPMPARGSPTAYDQLEAEPLEPFDVAADFEAGVDVDPSAFLPADLVEGPHHVVSGVWNDGFTNRYLLVTDFGSLEVETTGLLRKRIHEISVVGQLDEDEVSGNMVYFLSTANAARGPVEGAAQWIMNPIDSAWHVPTGMWSYARRLVALAGRDRTFQEDHYSEELIGFSDAKREWAYRLGVDVYSENSVLQRRLNRYAWLSLGGGLTVRLPLMAVAGPAGYALTVSGTTDQMKRELRDRSPEEVRIDVRSRLALMEMDPVLIERFVSHPWYPPTRLLVISESLGALGEAQGRSHFIEAAVHADEPQETYLFTRLALMLALYSEREQEIERVESKDGLIWAETRDGRRVVPLYIDWATWSEAFSYFMEAVDAVMPPSVAQKQLLLSGWVSPRAREHLNRGGWTLHEGVEMNWLAEVDRAAWAPGQPDPNRVLPEFGERSKGE